METHSEKIHFLSLFFFFNVSMFICVNLARSYTNEKEEKNTVKVDVCENIIKLDISKNKTNTAYVQHIFSFFFFLSVWLLSCLMCSDFFCCCFKAT